MELMDLMEARRLHRESLKKNPDMLREFRPILQDSLEAKLESMGLRKVYFTPEHTHTHIPCFA